MEEDSSNLPHKKITLLFMDEVYKLDKEKLMSECEYFRTMFNQAFSDSKDDIIKIKFAFRPDSFKDFCTWMEKDSPPADLEIPRIPGKSCLEHLEYSEDYDHFDRLRNLLEISLVYHANNLIRDLTSIVAQHWLNSCSKNQRYFFDIWISSLELRFPELADLAKFLCCQNLRSLDQSLFSRKELTHERFVSLMGSVHHTASKEYLSNVIDARLSVEADDLKRKDLNDLLNRIKLAKRESWTMNCFFVDTTKKEGSDFVISRDIFSLRPKKCVVNPHNKFERLINVWKTMCGDNKDLVGAGIIGKGSNIFRVGGEIRIGSNKFLLNVGRYCLITKRWYYLTRLRTPRRHMGLAISNDKLIVIGGVGRYRMKQSSIEMLDMTENTWTRGPELPETFTDIPACCVVRGMVVIHISRLYIFNPLKNSWIGIQSNLHPNLLLGVRTFGVHGDTVYFVTSEFEQILAFKIQWVRDACEHDDGDCECDIVGAIISQTQVSQNQDLGILLNMTIANEIQSVAFCNEVDDLFNLVSTTDSFQKTSVEYSRIDESKKLVEKFALKDFPSFVFIGNGFQVIDPDYINLNHMEVPLND
ncbi:uncharacterized protein LOC106649195 [Trichogramma pretiosum]|uniref:uncharacterized protein LOC106649195 n=1 Tax=Trichogramma pretiosum TaxID=7493 RepID=UPI0006C95CCD|nr:uncharacterized protein LOC106649195 [Trichogramma pretiosum]XP_014221969.1 uncharacterized protein LOC106649195 [Trichogramma pretiosum]